MWYHKRQARVKKYVSTNNGRGAFAVADVFSTNLNQAKYWHYVKYENIHFLHLTSEFLFLCLDP